MFKSRLLRIVLLTALLVPIASTASSATIANNDDKAVVLSIVENGNRSELVIEAGATNSLCDAGCFVTLPNGDRIGLSGSETIRIVNGVAVIQ